MIQHRSFIPFDEFVFPFFVIATIVCLLILQLIVVNYHVQLHHQHSNQLVGPCSLTLTPIPSRSVLRSSQFVHGSWLLMWITPSV